MNPDELQKLPLFAGLSSEESSCLEQGEEIVVAAGELIAKEGDPATFFYVILEGEIRVSKTYGNQKVVMAVHTPGKFFGEVPLLLDMPYFIDGQARTPCRLLRYSKDQFWALMRMCPSAAKEILRTMAARLRGLEGFSQRRGEGTIAEKMIERYLDEV
jgi:CRP-like cAMP-binding protein